MTSPSLVCIIQFGNTGDLRFASSVRFFHFLHLLESIESREFVGNTRLQNMLDEVLWHLESRPEVGNLKSALGFHLAGEARVFEGRFHEDTKTILDGSGFQLDLLGHIDDTRGDKV